MSGSSSRLAPVLLLAVLGSAIGSAFPAATADLRRDLDALTLVVDRLRQEQTELRSRLESLGSGPSRAEQEIARFQGRLDALEAQTRAVAERLAGAGEHVDALVRDLDRLRSRVDGLERRAVAAPTGGGPAAGGAAPEPLGLPGGEPSGGEESTAATFQRAYADYSQGHYDLAEIGFAGVLKQPDAAALSDDATYYLAEIAAARGQRDAALAGYGRVISEYPTGDKVPAATLKKGLLLIDANRIGEGILQLDHLVKAYPQTDEARLARNKLRALGVGP